MATEMSRPANNGRLPSQSALGVADESGIVENHADGRARSIDKKASNCRARRPLTPIIGNKSLTLNALWNPCAGLTVCGSVRPILSGWVSGAASPLRVPQFDVTALFAR